MEGNNNVETTETKSGLTGLDFSNFTATALPENDNLGSGDEPEDQPETAPEETTEQNDDPGTEAPPEETPEAEAPPETPSEPQPETKVVDWKEAIKGMDISEVLSALGDKEQILKGLGVSEFVINLNKHMEENGDAAKYLQVHSKDYEAMDDAAVILEGIRSEKPNAPESVIRKLYAREMAKYETDPEEDDEDAAELNNYLKKEKADEYRSKFAEERKRFAIPEKTEKTEAERLKAEADAKAAADNEAKAKEFRDKIINSPVSKELVSGKILKIGDKKDYNFEVSDPQELIDMATGDKNFYGLFLNENGELDMELWFATAAFAKNRKLYESSLVNHGRTLANKESIEAEENPPDRAARDSSPTKASPFAALNVAAMKR